MKGLVIFLIVFMGIGIVSFSNLAFAVEDQDSTEKIYFRGNIGPLVNCENYTYHVDGAFNTYDEKEILIEIINPNGKVVGSDITTSGGYDGDIQINDWSVGGRYLIHVTYDGVTYEEDFGASPEDGIATKEEKIQCFVDNEIKKIDESVESLKIGKGYGTDWNNSKDALRNILGDEQFNFYEPIISRDAIFEDPPFESRVETSYAFENLAELENTLLNYYEKTITETFSQAEQNLSEMNLMSVEDRAEMIYRLRIVEDNYFENHQYVVDNFLGQIKGLYERLDASDLSYQKYEEEQLRKEKEKEEAKQAIIEEFYSEKEENLEPKVETNVPLEPESEPIMETKVIEEDKQESDFFSGIQKIFESLFSWF